MATRAHRGSEGIDGVREASVNEARAQAERGVVRLRFVRRPRGVTELDGHALGEPCLGDPLDRDHAEVGRQLDPVPCTPGHAGEEQSRPASSRRDVEDA